MNALLPNSIMVVSMRLQIVSHDLYSLVLNFVNHPQLWRSRCFQSTGAAPAAYEQVTKLCATPEEKLFNCPSKVSDLNQPEPPLWHTSKLEAYATPEEKFSCSS